MEAISLLILSLFPDGFDPIAMLQIFAFITAAVVIVGVAGRVAFGKGSALAHAVASSIAILFVYVIIAMLNSIGPGALDDIVNRLPLVTFKGSEFTLFTFGGKDYATICVEVLHVLILAFIVICLDDLIPDAKNTLSWFIMQFVIVCFATLIYCFVIHCLDTYLPDVLNSYAPMILISILAFMLLLGVLKVVFGLMLTVVNPLFGAVYTFFFASKFGQSISKAALSTLTLSALVLFMENMDYTRFSINGATFIAYLTVMIPLLALWFLLGHVL